MSEAEYAISTPVKFEAAHRQLGDQGKCGFLHGHNWEAIITIVATELTPLGYIIDFKDLKDIVSRYDHKVILNEIDPLAIVLRVQEQRVITIEGNPTCEILAKQIVFDIVEWMAKYHLVQPTYVGVKLFENDTSFAQFALEVKPDGTKSK